jgi:Flp pilus assembly protein CpaB
VPSGRRRGDAGQHSKTTARGEQVSIQASKPNNRVFLLLGIVLAALAFGGVLFALRQSSGNTVSVVVAKDTINAGTTITADQLTTVDLPQSGVPSDGYQVTSAVTGKTTSVTIGKNDPLVPAFFAATPLAGSATTTSANGTSVPVSLETALTKGFVAMAIPAAGELPQPPPGQPAFTQLQQNNVSADLTSAGFYIQPGDHIDVIALDLNNNTAGTRFTFQDVPVLRVGTQGSSGSPTVYVVMVSRSQAELLAGFSVGLGHETTLRYVLRPQSEWGKVTPGNTGYTPNYESPTGPPVPNTSDTPVEASTLDTLFGH